MPSAPTEGGERVIVLGAGFAGLGAVRKLRKAPVDVLLVDRNDYHSFQPMLYQVATDVLDPETVGRPVREHLHGQANARFVTATATSIDLETRTVGFEDWDDQRYDHLVVALGARVNWFGTTGAEEHAFPLYTLNHAIRLKDHLLERFEQAARDGTGSAARMLDTVIVGGGPTGVETAGALADLFYRTLAEDAPRLDMQDVRITLVDHGDRLLKMFDEGMSAYARDALEQRGVVVRLGEAVAEVGADAITLGSGEVIPTATTVWGAGLAPSPLAPALCAEPAHGRVPVGPMLSLEGHPEVYVVGDLARIRDGPDGDVLPQLGSVAMQAGEHVGRTIDRLTRRHKEPEPFRYHDRGTMATIGRGAAVAHVPPDVHLTGKPAFLAWGAVHLALLSGGDARSAALTNWFWTMLRHDRPSRVLIHPDDED